MPPLSGKRLFSILRDLRENETCSHGTWWTLSKIKKAIYYIYGISVSVSISDKALSKAIHVLSVSTSETGYHHHRIRWFTTKGNGKRSWHERVLVAITNDFDSPPSLPLQGYENKSFVDEIEAIDITGRFKKISERSPREIDKELSSVRDTSIKIPAKIQGRSQCRRR